MSADSILDAIDGALADHDLSADAMRWTPGEKQATGAGESGYPVLLYSPVAKAAACARMRRAERNPWERFRHWVHAGAFPELHRERCLKCRGGEQARAADELTALTEELGLYGGDGGCRS